MGFEAPSGVVIREKESPRAAGPITCPKCRATNPPATLRCRSCLTPLPSKAAAAPRTVTPVPRQDVDAILGELEALTLEEDHPRDISYQCPACGRSVEETASRCRCGAIFRDAQDIVGYACPLCGARVSETATRCRCGARFAD